MSLEAMLAVKRLRGITPSARIILYAFADYADRGGGSVWPSLRTIGEECEVDERTVRRIVRSLESTGLLLRGEQRGTPPHATYSYTLTFVQGGHIAPGGREGAPVSADPVIRSLPTIPDEEDQDQRIGGHDAPPVPPRHRNHGALEQVIRREYRE